MFGVYENCAMTMSKTLVWISGDTYPVKDSLKADGFKWSGKKRAWWMTIADYMSKISAVNSETDDYTIMSTASDGTAVVVAECHHIDITEEA